jgi:hypothetical protein
MAENVEKTSGLPFPKAKNVTPAVVSLNPRYVAIVDKFGQKKSEATIPINENKNDSNKRYAKAINGFEWSEEVLYHSE